MELTSLPLGDLQTNCYLAWDNQTREALIIDPADSGDFITDQVVHLQLQPVGIVLTHGHFDHVLGLLEVSLNFPVPVMMHQADVFLVKQAASSARYWLHRQVDPVPIPTTFIDQHQTLSFGRERLQILEVPGHTPGSLCLYNDQAIFSGDTLFATGVGRTDFNYSDAYQLQTSLKKMAQVLPNVPIFPGHGESTHFHQALNTIGYNP